MPCTQCGWPPTTRSAPAGPAAAHVALHRLGLVGVLRAPVRQHHHHVDLAGRARTARSTRAEVAAQGTGPRGHPHRERPGASVAALGVSPMALKPRNPNRTPSAPITAARRRGQVATGPERPDPAPPQRTHRVQQRVVPEVADVVVGQRQRVEPRIAGDRPAPECRRTSRRPGWARPGGQRALQVADGEGLPEQGAPSARAPAQGRSRREPASRRRRRSARRRPRSGRVHAVDPRRDDGRTTRGERYDGQGAGVALHLSPRAPGWQTGHHAHPPPRVTRAPFSAGRKCAVSGRVRPGTRTHDHGAERTHARPWRGGGARRCRGARYRPLRAPRRTPPAPPRLQREVDH